MHHFSGLCITQKYENKFFAAAKLFNVLFKVGIGKSRIFLRNLNMHNFMIPRYSRLHHRLSHIHHVGIIHG
jgi:hypothetical protein